MLTGLSAAIVGPLSMSAQPRSMVIKVSNAEMKTLDIQGDAFHPEWNYTIRQRSAPNRSD